jgi:hypothetical protein
LTLLHLFPMSGGECLCGGTSVGHLLLVGSMVRLARYASLTYRLVGEDDRGERRDRRNRGPAATNHVPRYAKRN